MAETVAGGGKAGASRRAPLTSVTSTARASAHPPGEKRWRRHGPCRMQDLCELTPAHASSCDPPPSPLTAALGGPAWMPRTSHRAYLSLHPLHRTGSSCTRCTPRSAHLSLLTLRPTLRHVRLPSVQASSWALATPSRSRRRVEPRVRARARAGVAVSLHNPLG